MMMTTLLLAALAGFIDPMIGTADTGNCYPGPTWPLGMIQPGPDVHANLENSCGGYIPSCDILQGFTLTHLSGVGCCDMQDVLVLPFVGETPSDPFGPKGEVDHRRECAEAGYYAADIVNFGIRAEVTASRRVAYYRFTYPVAEARLYIDNSTGPFAWWAKPIVTNRVLESSARFEKGAFVGCNLNCGWLRHREIYYRLEFSVPPRSVTELATPDRTGRRHVLDFDLGGGRVLEIKAAVSFISEAGAEKNLRSDPDGFDFDARHAACRTAWERLCAGVSAEGDAGMLKSFYTSLYHLYLQPSLHSDADGAYRNAAGKVCTASCDVYSTFSTWDTFRAAHPLYTILTPGVVRDFCDSMLKQYDAVGYLPIWQLNGQETHAMYACHSIPVIQDALEKGLCPGVDERKIFAAMEASVKGRLAERVDRGWYPYELEKGIWSRPVSAQLEDIIDDWCAARLARRLGLTERAEVYERAAASWKKLYDAETGMLRGRDSAGAFRTPFDRWNHGPTIEERLRGTSFDYAEGSAVHWAWHVLGDPRGLIAAHGGNARFVRDLDEMFNAPELFPGQVRGTEMTGAVGQYVQGNEPTHHVPYLYALAGRPDRTAEVVREIFDRYYSPQKDGLCGNDDCGQMSAWYVFSAMGFYPVTPVGGEYVLGAPQLPHVSIALPGGKRFDMFARNLSRKNKYVASVTFNGARITDGVLHHAQIMQGGELVFEMTDKPRPSTGNLFADFTQPPDAAKPWCYWNWVNGNVDRATITRDLEAMKRVGFGGLLMNDTRGYDTVVWKPAPKMAFGSPEWVSLVCFSVRECARLGLTFTMNISDSGGSLKGPALTGEDGPKRLVCGVNVSDVPADYRGYHDICTQEVFVDAATEVRAGWRNAGGVTGRWERDAAMPDVAVVSPDAPNAKKVTLRFGYCLIPNREHDVDVIDPQAVERHFHRMTDALFAEVGDLVGKVWTHVYSVSWEGAIPTWTDAFEAEFLSRTGYAIRPHLAELAGFARPDTPRILADYRRVRNAMFKDNFYGTLRRLAHAHGLALCSESGGPWNRDPSVFREADQLAFLGVNDMPQGEFWAVRPFAHPHEDHVRPAANAAHIYGLPRASAEAFTFIDLPYSVWPERLKRSADRAFADGINHFVWHTFTCSPEAFGKPGIEYFAGTHFNPNVTWFEEGAAFVTYLARCQMMLQAGWPVADIAVYGGKTPYQHWGRYRRIPWDGSRLAIPRGYNYDVLNDEMLAKKADYPVFIDGTAAAIAWPELPLPDFEGELDDVIHRRLADGTDIYFVRSEDRFESAMTFRVSGKVAELWDPVRGTRQLAQGVTATPDGRTRVPLFFLGDGSVFVVFRPKEIALADPAPVQDWPAPQPPISLPDAAWKVEVAGKNHDMLGDWTKSDDPDIRYFSGKAHYRTAFALDEEPKGDRTLLLGRIHGGLGRVRVNGWDCGVVWCLPYKVRIPALSLKKGENTLEVEVVNTWRNRLIGDCFLAPSERRTKGCLKYKTAAHGGSTGDIWTAHLAEGYSRNDALEPCGLYGPVELR